MFALTLSLSAPTKARTLLRRGRDGGRRRIRRLVRHLSLVRASLDTAPIAPLPYILTKYALVGRQCSPVEHRNRSHDILVDAPKLRRRATGLRRLPFAESPRQHTIPQDRLKDWSRIHRRASEPPLRRSRLTWYRQHWALPRQPHPNEQATQPSRHDVRPRQHPAKATCEGVAIPRHRWEHGNGQTSCRTLNLSATTKTRLLPRRRRA